MFTCFYPSYKVLFYISLDKSTPGSPALRLGSHCICPNDIPTTTYLAALIKVIDLYKFTVNIPESLSNDLAQALVVTCGSASNSTHMSRAVYKMQLSNLGWPLCGKLQCLCMCNIPRSFLPKVSL